MSGYIKDHRKELDSDIWIMPPLYHRVWQYLKYKVNHEEAEIPMNDGTKFKIQPGQHLTSVRGIAQGVGWYEGHLRKEPNPKTIKTILDWLVKVRMIEVDCGRGNRQYTLITLSNWDLYNKREEQGNSKVTADGEVRKQSADINKNDKERIKNEKEINKKYTPEFDQFWSVYPRKVGKAASFTRWKTALKLDSSDYIIQCATNYAKECQHKQTDEQYIKHPSTFLQQERYKDYFIIVLGGGNSAKHERGVQGIQYGRAAGQSRSPSITDTEMDELFAASRVSEVQ